MPPEVTLAVATIAAIPGILTGLAAMLTVWIQARRTRTEVRDVRAELSPNHGSSTKDLITSTAAEISALHQEMSQGLDGARRDISGLGDGFRLLQAQVWAGLQEHDRIRRECQGRHSSHENRANPT